MNNADQTSIIDAYERMYGEKNSKKQLNVVLESYKPKRRRRRRKKHGRSAVNENVANVKIDINKKGDLLGMSKFNELFNSAVKLNEQLEVDDVLDPMGSDEGAMDLDAGGDDQVTVTLDVEHARALCDVLQAALPAEDDESDDAGEELPGDDLAEEEGPAFYEGAGEDSLETAPDGVKHMTGGHLAAGAKQDIGSQTHQKGVGSTASQQPEKPKPLTHKNS